MIDTANFALPKPGHAAGAKVLSSYAYSKLKREKLRQQGGCCALCPRPIDSPGEAHLHHKSRISFTAVSGESHGRGIGGGKRNDLESLLICIECHIREEGKKNVQKEGFKKAPGAEGDPGQSSENFG